jgi:glycerol-3-phosphate dehydrogenase
MFDVCVIGAGGVVGAALVRELTQRGFSVAGLEKHAGSCRETSGMNSRVIHSGFHEHPGSLKARLAREGSRMILEYVRERGIPVLNTGMLIAIPRGAIGLGLLNDAGSLWRLWSQGRRHNIPFRFVLGSASVMRIAPVNAVAGIFIPPVSVIDVEAFVQSLTDDAKQLGADFRFGTEVLGIAVNSERHVVQTSTGDIEARILVNSAGLCAREIAAMAGTVPPYNVELIRGDYYELIGGVDRWGIRTLVYPVMPARSKSKGIHFGPRTDGRLYIGPSATMTSSSEPADKDLFLKAARRFVPAVREEDLRWAYSGTRPKSGRDFSIRLDRRQPPLINLIGIDSPGLSSSMAIARFVAEMMELQGLRATQQMRSR